MVTLAKVTKIKRMKSIFLQKKTSRQRICFVILFDLVSKLSSILRKQARSLWSVFILLSARSLNSGSFQ